MKGIAAYSTLCNLSLKSCWTSWPRRLGGMYQKHTFVHSGSRSTMLKPSVFLIFSVK